jgi:hypothetical protein
MAQPGSAQHPDFSPEEWETVKDLVFEAEQNPPADLAVWLEAQAVSPKIRAEVERLVKSSSECGDFLQKTAARDYLDPAIRPPERIGRYKVLESLGSGGMGVVYAAMDPELDRRWPSRCCSPIPRATPNNRSACAGMPKPLPVCSIPTS